MPNNATLNDPDIRRTITELRRAREEHAEIKRRASLEKFAIKERATETARALHFLRHLTLVKGRGLKRAVIAIVYWDHFAFVKGDVMEDIRKANWKVNALFAVPNAPGNRNLVARYLGSRELAAALQIFGYRDPAGRIANRSYE